MLDCYYMDLSGDCSYEQSLVLSEYLIPERKERVQRLKNKTVAVKQVLSGIFLQYCLCGKLGMSLKDSKKELKLIYNEKGKPYLENDRFFFNLSHSGNYAVLAISDLEVGIDVEQVREKRINVAGRFFHKEEYEDIISAEDKHKQDLRFLRYWTMKEAFVKCCGAGLAIPLDSFILVNKGEIYTVTDVSEHGFMNCNDLILKVFRLTEEYNVALCTYDGRNLQQMNKIWDDNVNVKKINYYDIFSIL